jgi:diguanylate cyclase (GGDEF)-like protein
MSEDTPHILVVDDSRTISRILCNSIKNKLGFDVSVTTSLAETKAFFDEHDPDELLLAILDLTLPDAPHGEVVDYVLSCGVTAIVMTATFDESMHQAFLSKKIADYIIKESARDVEYLTKLIRRIHSNQQIKLLVVDDSMTYQTLLKQYLDIHRYQVLTALDGSQAMDMINKHGDIRVVITDYMMPVMDGYQLTQQIRKKHPKDELIIIGLSGQSDGASSVSAQFLKKGANDYLSKPFSKEELYYRLNQNLELIELLQETRDLANRDFLSGLYNRRYFFDAGAHFYEHARRKRLTLAVAMVDIDFFKKVNDKYGHDVGDTAIKHVADILMSSVRKSDIVSRFGGEEFCLLMADPDRDALRAIFERIRTHIELSTVVHDDIKFNITTSIGVAEYCGHGTMEELIALADEQLYFAKDGGRNRVMIAPPE